eukprot:scaffold5370_cov96-Cylindrotheca_fusiformis.AAC.1
MALGVEREIVPPRDSLATSGSEPYGRTVRRKDSSGNVSRIIKSTASSRSLREMRKAGQKMLRSSEPEFQSQKAQIRCEGIFSVEAEKRPLSRQKLNFVWPLTVCRMTEGKKRPEDTKNAFDNLAPKSSICMSGG